jgi:hypothetical protein
MSTVKSPFDLARKYLEPMPEQLATDSQIIAVKICSPILDACIWFSFDPDFKPDTDDESLAVFYSDEIPFLADKTPAQLKEIHQWKLTFGPGTRVRQ